MVRAGVPPTAADVGANYTEGVSTKREEKSCKNCARVELFACFPLCSRSDRPLDTALLLVSAGGGAACDLRAYE